MNIAVISLNCIDIDHFYIGPIYMPPFIGPSYYRWYMVPPFVIKLSTIGSRTYLQQAAVLRSSCILANIRNRQ